MSDIFNIIFFVCADLDVELKYIDLQILYNEVSANEPKYKTPFIRQMCKISAMIAKFHKATCSKDLRELFPKIIPLKALYLGCYNYICMCEENELDILRSYDMVDKLPVDEFQRSIYRICIGIVVEHLIFTEETDLDYIDIKLDIRDMVKYFTTYILPGIYI
jgi:hypothetical protein